MFVFFTGKLLVRLSYLQYPLMMRPATTWLSFSQCLTLPETGAPSNTTSSMIPSQPADQQYQRQITYTLISNKSWYQLILKCDLYILILIQTYTYKYMIPFLLTISSKQEKMTRAPRLYPINVIGRFPCQKQLLCYILRFNNGMLFYRTIKIA